jgi:DNA ligase (NAD+)
MNKEEAKKRIEKLKDTINHHRYLYHVLDRQEISDSALDSLKKELFDLEQKFPDLIDKNSPTQRVGGKPLEKFQKIKHEERMLSFNDAFSVNDMEDWKTRVSKLLTSEEQKKLSFYCELKIDGLAIELVYKNGVLESGSTRGDGVIGENVTQNLKTIEAIPLVLFSKEKIIDNLEKGNVSNKIIESTKKYNFQNEIIVRGEAFISKNEFVKVNREQEKNGLAIYSNPRNLAAGSIRQLDPKVTAKRKLDSFAYELLTDFGAETHFEKHAILEAMGFKINSNNKYCDNLVAVFDFYKHCQKIREKINYEIDGVVVIVNSNRVFKKLGVVGKAPRGAIAFKFPAKQVTTIVEDIKIQVGRTGALTPVAYLKPVDISGVTVSRATLHNEDEIRRLGVKIGDTVIVSRAGDVIPDIIRVLPELRTGREKEFRMPSKCPICESKTEKKAGEVNYYCTNPECFAKQKENFYHFVSKGAFDIRGLGPKIIDRLIEEGLIIDGADIFKLKEGDILPLERFADKSAENLITSIQTHKKITLAKFLYALGIRNVGEKTAEELAREFKNLEEIKNAKFEEFKKIDDFGPIVTQSILNWFNDKKNSQLIDKLKKVGIEITNNSNVKDRKLKGLTFVITGTLPTISREKAKEIVKEHGGSISDALSNKTSYLLCGENPGSKFEKAKANHIKIIEEKEFFKLVER